MIIYSVKKERKSIVLDWFAFEVVYFNGQNFRRFTFQRATSGDGFRVTVFQFDRKGKENPWHIKYLSMTLMNPHTIYLWHFPPLWERWIFPEMLISKQEGHLRPCWGFRALKCLCRRQNPLYKRCDTFSKESEYFVWMFLKNFRLLTSYLSHMFIYRFFYTTKMDFCVYRKL